MASSPHVSILAPRIIVAVLLCLSIPRASGAASDAMLLRLFLRDGATLVSYGEYTRVDDRVIFSMIVGGSTEQPQLQAVTLSASTRCRTSLRSWMKPSRA